MQTSETKMKGSSEEGDRMKGGMKIKLKETSSSKRCETKLIVGV